LKMERRKKIVVLGATGSVGASALDVVRSHPGDFEVVAVSALRSRERCERIAAELGAKAYVGEGAAKRAVEESDADVCLVATVGLSGLAPTMAAIGKGMPVALATKEVLVAAGGLVTAAAKARGVPLIPVDSEHSAVFQCMSAGAGGAVPVKRIALTASGGPFLDGPEDLSSVTAAQALAHPRWKMGPKVTVDSATMMNKGFEIIEACWLFGVSPDRVDVVVHPESTVHALVTFEDGATLAQLSPPDMRVAVQYAFTWPGRIPAERAALDLAAAGALTFRRPDESRFPCLGLAKEAFARGGSAPAVLVAADEWAVGRFIEGRIRFTDIARAVESCLKAAPASACESEEEVAAACDWATGHLEATWRY